MRYLGKVSYLGTNFQGWQKQNNAQTIQGKLEEALQDIDSFERIVYRK